MVVIISSNPSLQDLNITFQESVLVFPLHETEKKSIFLSNIDQALNYKFSILYFFQANPDYSPQVVSQRLKLALQRVLVPYDFVAGRMKLDHDSGRLEIDCNAAGAGFVVASSDFSLAEIGDLFAPNLGFRQLGVHTFKEEDDDQPLFILQLTSFRCGGFAIGMSVNHSLFDGRSAKTFCDNLASQAAFDDKPLVVVPHLDRRLLEARSPPRVAFHHPEYCNPDISTAISAAPSLDRNKEELETRVFQLSQNDINFLKDMARTSSPETNARISSMSVAAALIWRCKALSKDQEYDKERVSTLLNAVDIRSRLNPPLPPSYCGGAVLWAHSTARCEDLDKGPFAEVVKMVAEGASRVSDEYAKSAIDWLEIHKGLRCGEYMMTCLMRLGFQEVVFPWGKPLHACPGPDLKKYVCFMFPGTANGQFNALVTLPPSEMERFQSHFINFFRSHSNNTTDRSATP